MCKLNAWRTTNLIIILQVSQPRRSRIILFLGSIFNPAIHYVIPAAAKRRAGIQQMPQFYWIPAFAGMTGG
jgi:hypothetical protein